MNWWHTPKEGGFRAVNGGVDGGAATAAVAVPAIRLRFRRGKSHYGKGDGSAGLQRARRRLEQRRSEKARVAAEGVLSRVMGDGSGIEVGVMVGVPRVGEGDEDTRGRRAAVMLCDSCLTKNLRAGAPDTEAARMKLKRVKEAAKKAKKGKGREQADGVTQQATESSGASGAGASGGKRKRSNGRRLKRSATTKVAALAAKHGLTDMKPDEVRAMERAMAGEAVRFGGLLREGIEPLEAAREDATEWRRHREWLAFAAWGLVLRPYQSYAPGWSGSC
jgi:hypothetical protein